MKIHKTGVRHSLNGTSAELHALANRLNALLSEMDAHDAELAAIRVQRGDARGAGEHFVDFGLEEIDGLVEHPHPGPGDLAKLVHAKGSHK
jgi:hypothetical protein